MIVGFLGVVCVVQPSGEGVNVYALLALGVAVIVGVRDLLTRIIGFAVPALMMSLITTISVCLGHWIYKQRHSLLIRRVGSYVARC